MNIPAISPIEPVSRLLPRIGRGAAAASRVLYSRRLQGGWARAVEGLEFVPLQGRPVEVVQQVSLQTRHGPMSGYFSAPDFPSVNVCAAEPGALPAALQQLAAEALMQPLIDALSAVGVADVAVSGMSSTGFGVDEVPASGWVRLLRNGKPVAGFVCVQLPDAVPREIVRRLGSEPFASRFGHALACHGRLTLGSRSVLRSILESLMPGDVLLLASAADGQRADCRVAFGARGGRRWSAAAVVGETSLTLRGAGRMNDEDDDDDIESPQGADHEAERARGTADVKHDIQVPVRFEIETVPLSLAEIEAMSDGYVIELSTPLANARIKLVSCGHVIGFADLVAVGDRLGARITHMASSDAARHVD